MGTPFGIVGLAEVAGLLGLSKPAAARRMNGADAPPPVADLASGRVWTRSQIVDYAQSRCIRFHERASIEALAGFDPSSSPPGP